MKHLSKPALFGAPILVGIIVLAFAIARIGAEDDQGNDAPDNGLRVAPVTIDSVSVNLAESFPVQVFVLVEGYMPDPCWVPREPHITGHPDGWEIEILAERDPDEVCPQVIESYEETIALGEAESGTYTLNVNGFETEFEVQ